MKKTGPTLREQTHADNTLLISLISVMISLCSLLFVIMQKNRKHRDNGCKDRKEERQMISPIKKESIETINGQF